MKILKEILKNVEVLKLVGNDSVLIHNIVFDSRKVTNEDLFVALRGTVSDGHSYIEQVVKSGVKAILCEKLPENYNTNITYILVKDTSYALGFIASNYFDNPSSKIKLVGVTGTNGKTTIATTLYRLFKKLGYKVGLFSTVRNYINNQAIESTHTTPDSLQLNYLLSEMINDGCEFCFMEVSSHSVVQNRISGLTFTGGIFTNITHDHLDYHKTFEEYIKAKKLFFDNLSANAFALSNNDDKNGKVMLQNCLAKKHMYSVRTMSDFKCRVIDSDFVGTMLHYNGFEVFTNFVGNFNAYNILSVIATAELLNQNRQEVLTAVSSLFPVDGRFETFRFENGVTAIVDYAHTPDALINVIKTINTIRGGNGNLITVVGAGGNRDKTKRPVMAKVASELSNKVILTSDNPRNEKPEDILADMQKGVEPHNSRKVITISDRKEAIKTACMLAVKNDIILIAGKGHETYQEVNGVKHHFDDKEVVKEFLK